MRYCSCLFGRRAKHGLTYLFLAARSSFCSLSCLFLFALLAYLLLSLYSLAPCLSVHFILFATQKSSSSSSSFAATIVTSYFCVPSKRSKTAYLDYMKVMLSLQDPMVIFTSAEMRSTIESMRSHAMDRTHIVIVELQDLPVAKKYDSLDAGYWKHQLEIDEEKRIHRSFELFWIWLSKSHFVNEAIKLNPFRWVLMKVGHVSLFKSLPFSVLSLFLSQSSLNLSCFSTFAHTTHTCTLRSTPLRSTCSTDVFVWTDIGCFRSKEYTSKTLVMHPEEVPASKMLVMTSRDDRAEAGVKNQEWVEKRLKDHVMFVAGAQIAGRVETWKTFHIAFERVVQGYYDKGLFIGEDQNLIQSTCLQNLELCEFVSPKQTKGNRWFGLQYVLFHKRRDGVVVPPPVYVEETAEKEAPQKEAAKKSPISEVYILSL